MGAILEGAVVLQSGVHDVQQGDIIKIFILEAVRIIIIIPGFPNNNFNKC